VERGSEDLSARFRSVATHGHHAKLKVESPVPNIHLIKLTSDNKTRRHYNVPV
jgi:hypothetical protein